MLRALPPMKVSSTSTSPPSLPPVLGLHGEPEAVKHEPRGLLSDAERAREFVAADAVLALASIHSAGSHLSRPIGRVLEDGADLDARTACRTPCTSRSDESSRSAFRDPATGTEGPSPRSARTFTTNASAIASSAKQELACWRVFGAVSVAMNRDYRKCPA